MGQPAARKDDQVLATDIHIVMIPTPGGEVPTPLPHPFIGKITTGVSTEETVPIEVPGFPRPTVRQHVLVRTARSSDNRKHS